MEAVGIVLQVVCPHVHLCMKLLWNSVITKWKRLLGRCLDNDRSRSYVFEVVASKLREEYGIDNIYITGEEISNTPPKFPAVCIMQSDNIINTDYSTFNENENVAIETYKIEVVSIDSKMNA